MTEKEKAEAYDKAIERAKKLYDNGITEEIFPELKEDDTDRIKKELIQWVDEFPDIIWRGHYKKDIIDWLEKQGKKSSWKPSKEEMDALYSLSYITNEYDEHKEDVITHLYQDLKREFFNDSSYENMFSLDNKEDDVRRRSTIQVLEYVRSLDAYNQYGKADIDKNIAWLEKQGESGTFDIPQTPIKDAVEVTSRMQFISDDMKPIAEFIMGYANWNLHKDEWNQPTLTVPLFRVLDALIQRGKPYGECSQNIEKQDEQKPTIEMKSAEESLGISSEEYNKIVDKLIYDEQKHTDKVEPKFKVGDWIITPKNKVLQLTSIDDTSYCDEQCRFWTIEDAKDGDILACNEEILLFKSYSVLQGRISLYCWYNGQTNNFHSKEVIDILLTTTNKVCPATKEQCDTLMKAMNDAGYEWDAETKTLKKLVEPKFKVGDKITNTFRKYVGASGSQVIISEITDNKYIFTDGSYIFISNQDSWELAPDKNPKFDTETLKTYNDINIGDTVYIWGSGDSSVDETTITEKYDDRGHWNLKFSNGCVGRALKNGTSSTMGMYACLVYSDKEAVRESINERIKILSNIKI